MAVTLNASNSGTGGLSVTSDATGNLAFQTAGTTAVTVDTSQNVGIGTASPTALTSNKALTINSPTGFGSLLDLKTNETLNLRVYSNASSSGLSVKTATPLVFDTNDLERMRIDSSGNVGIGTNVPATYGALAVRKGVAGTWYGVVGNCSFQTSDAAANSFSIIHNSTALYLGTDTSTRLQMFCSATASGGVYLSNGATSWTSASDERVKENLVPIENGLTKVASLRAVTGNYINDEDKKSRPFLIAQDVYAVLPEAVDNSNPDELGLSYTDVIPLLVASIKELKAINDTQAETINALTARIVALETA
jgi:hypothetical protein